MQRYLPALKNCPLFESLSDADILGVLHCCNTQILHVDKNNFIFHAGDTTDSFGIVVSGSVFTVQEDIDGNRDVISKYYPGDLFGEAYALSPGSVMDISAIASEKSEILKLRSQRLITVCPVPCRHHTRVLLNLQKSLANKIFIYNDKMTHMSKHKTRDKLLSYLRAESLRHNSLSFDIPFDRQQLADFLCVERAAMSAELSKLHKEGLLTTEKSHFTLSPDAVEEI